MNLEREREAIFGMGLVVSRLGGADADKAALAAVLRIMAALSAGVRSLHERDMTRAGPRQSSPVTPPSVAGLRARMDASALAGQGGRVAGQIADLGS